MPSKVNKLPSFVGLFTNRLSQMHANLGEAQMADRSRRIQAKCKAKFEAFQALRSMMSPMDAAQEAHELVEKASMRSGTAQDRR